MRISSPAWLAHAGLMICLIITSGCTYRENAADRALAVASNGELIYVLDSARNLLYELKPAEKEDGIYREVPIEWGENTSLLPLTHLSDDGVLHLAGADDDGGFELLISKGEENYEIKRNTRDEASNSRLSEITGDSQVSLAEAAVIFSGYPSGKIDAPPGYYGVPVVAEDAGDCWYIIWQKERKETAGKGWKFTLGVLGYGEPGDFLVQRLKEGKIIDEYEIINETFIETRASGLVDAVVDDEGRLILLDNKGYLSFYDGLELTANIFGQMSISKYAMNTLAKGPGGTLLTTDAVGNTVSMIDPADSDLLSVWRLPRGGDEYAGGGLNWGLCAIDFILLVAVILMLSRISRRARRKREMKFEDVTPGREIER